MNTEFNYWWSEKKIAIKRLRKSEALKQSETNLQAKMFAINTQFHRSKVAGCKHDAPKTEASGDVLLARRLTPVLVPLVQRVSSVLPHLHKEVQWMCII
jgi:hypothetical protein